MKPLVLTSAFFGFGFLCAACTEDSIHLSFDGDQANRTREISSTEDEVPPPPWVVQRYAEAAAFLAGMQTTTPSSPDFGGLQEREDWAMEETDNTQEAIWLWSRYRRLTGDTSYDQNIADAWTYVMAWPAPMEPGAGYSVWNSGWGLTAEMEYRAATGDNQYLAYAESCADHILNTPLTMPEFYREASALPPLYRFGEEQQEQTYIDHAVTRGTAIRDEVDANNYLLAFYSWEVNGGTVFHAILETVFRENPEGRRAWALQHQGLLPGIGPVPPYSYSEWPHKLWSAAGHMAAYRAGAGPAAANFHSDLVNEVLDDDADNDGGVPKSSYSLDTRDESWVTAQLLFNGVAAQEKAIDIELEPDTYTVQAGGNLVLNYAARNNLETAQNFDLQVWAVPAGGTPLRLTTLTRSLGSGDAEEMTGIPLWIPAGAQPGEWALYLVAMDFSGALFDSDEVRFQVL